VYGSPNAPNFRHDRSSDTEATILTICRKNLPRLAPLVAVVSLLQAAARAEPVPLPRLRPSITPSVSPLIPLPRPRPAIPTPDVVAEPPPPSACQLGLTSDLAAIEILPPISGANGCGIADAVRLSAVITKDRLRVAITPPATLRCQMAETVAHWVRDEVAPIAATLGAPLGGIANYAAYECRGRNRVVGAQISEHGKGNALDIRALTLTNGRSYELTDIAVAKEPRERLKASACARFTTVLGPASDGFHEGHVHVDIAERRSGYRICQWAVRDASDLVPLPRARPAEAPPREP
jgi:hypothetical protein